MAVEVREPSVKKSFFVSVVLPAYNEESNIAREIETIRKAMETTDHAYEILIIDDGSTDRTAQIAEAMGVRVVRHGKNRGGGLARNTGILEARGNVIVASDADGTYPHEEIPKMLSFFPEYDMVIGARVGQVVEEPWYRRLPKDLIRRMASRLSRMEIPDLNSGFRAFKKDAARNYFSLFPPGHSWAGTITLAFLVNGHPVAFLPINYYKRKGGHSTFLPLADTYSYILLVIRTIMYFNPLGILLPLGLGLFTFGGVKVVYDWLRTQYIGGLDVFIMVTSINIIILGFIADFLAVLHRKKTPH
ncbi:MAG: glycosyltransferase family 2 protein [Elusimicrobia bacterium]|nr:glycosyltransferase family 2 protein [Elusimicrobiota bacterium]